MVNLGGFDQHHHQQHPSHQNERFDPNVTCNKKTNKNQCIFWTKNRIFFVFLLFSSRCLPAHSFSNSKDTNVPLDQCQRCKIVVDSFREGLKRTARGKHEGGDAHWEESKLSNYADSEIRLTEIQEGLCQDQSTGKDQCHSFAEEFESELEEWFLVERKKTAEDSGSGLFEYLCNTIGKVCCPTGHYGPDCKPCHGWPDNVCNQRGYCSGNGTRQGTGHCVCHQGYDGEWCHRCHPNYLAVGAADLPEQCLRCDESCASTCHSLGPKGCHVCRAGYFRDENHGCIDVDECSAQLELDPCHFNTYCVNTQGSYRCYPCHESCRGCTMNHNTCLECAPGYQFTPTTTEGAGRCTKITETVFKPRYLGYGSLCAFIYLVASCNRLILASCLALIVSLLIMAIEVPAAFKHLLM